MDVSSVNTITPSRPGKSAQAVGQIAKMAVAQAKTAGIDLPKNAQGMAASAIAKGAEPSSVFAALVSPDPEIDVVTPDTDVLVNEDGDDPMPPADPAVDVRTRVAESGYATAGAAMPGGVIQTDAEIALALLNEMA